MHLCVGWQLVGHFITDFDSIVISDWCSHYLCAHCLFRASSTSGFSSCFGKKHLGGRGSISFALNIYIQQPSKQERERQSCVHQMFSAFFNWYFDFPLFSLAIYHFYLTWLKLRLASVQPLCPYILSVIHPYQCALVNGKSGFASAWNTPVGGPGFMCENSKSRDQYDAVICTISVTFCTHWWSEGEAADNEKLHNNTAGNKGKCYNWLIRICFLAFWLGHLYLFSV